MFPVDTARAPERKDSKNSHDHILVASEESGSWGRALRIDAMGPVRWSVGTL